MKKETTKHDWWYPDIKVHRNTLVYSVCMFDWAIRRLFVQLGINKYKRWIRRIL